jgi:hypothetical protein
MKKFYIIVPIIMLAAFVAYYFSFIEGYEERQRAKEAEIARVEAEAEARKKEAERVAKADADRRAAERAAEEARKEAEKRKKWEDAGKEIADATARYNTDADKFAKEAGQLEIELLNLRGQKEKASREAFELAKRVELARIAKRNAELEIQRFTEMVARRAAESSMAQVAAATPPAKK